MKTFIIECPDGLADRLERLVRAGLVADEQQAMIEALRRFLDSHRPETRESQILADVGCSLRGKD
jgi:tRNA C32,U32 (ribose-2'-O)-methylase TrmJ